MAETEEEVQDAPQKKSKMPLILGLVFALAGGGGGFFAAYSGMIPIGQADSADAAAEAGADGKSPQKRANDIAFVEMEPLIVTLNKQTERAHLRFRAQLEVGKDHKGDVEYLLPRVTDVLNGYLRALQLADLEHPAALTRLRAQMLRRVQIVTGEGWVKDLLIMEFVIN